MMRQGLKFPGIQLMYFLSFWSLLYYRDSLCHSNVQTLLNLQQDFGEVSVSLLSELVFIQRAVARV